MKIATMLIKMFLNYLKGELIWWSKLTLNFSIGAVIAYYGLIILNSEFGLQVNTFMRTIM